MGEKGQVSTGVHQQQNMDFFTDLGNAAAAGANTLGQAATEAVDVITGQPQQQAAQEEAAAQAEAAKVAAAQEAARASRASQNQGGQSGEKGNAATGALPNVAAAISEAATSH